MLNTNPSPCMAGGALGIQPLHREPAVLLGLLGSGGRWEVCGRATRFFLALEKHLGAGDGRHVLLGHGLLAVHAPLDGGEALSHTLRPLLGDAQSLDDTLGVDDQDANHLWNGLHLVFDEQGDGVLLSLGGLLEEEFRVADLVEPHGGQTLLEFHPDTLGGDAVPEAPSLLLPPWEVGTEPSLVAVLGGYPVLVDHGGDVGLEGGNDGIHW